MAQRWSICLACTGLGVPRTAWQEENRKRCVCVLGYAHWTVATPVKENVAQVGTSCSCACSDSCRTYNNVTMHVNKKGN